MTSHLADRQQDENGFTVVEMVITLLISTLVMGSLLGILGSQQRAERRVQGFVSNQEEVRLTLVEMQRDIRAAEPLYPLVTADLYDYSIEMRVFDPDSTTDASSVVRWSIAAGSTELVRDVLTAPGGSSVGTTYRLKGVRNRLLLRPLFQYYSAIGNQFGLASVPADFATCTTRVKVDLVAGPDPRPAPVKVASDVQLRNRPWQATGRVTC